MKKKQNSPGASGVIFVFLVALIWIHSTKDKYTIYFQGLYHKPLSSSSNK